MVSNADRFSAPIIIALIGALSASGCGTPVITPTSDRPLAAPSTKATIGAFGLDLTGKDSTIKPGDDFYRFANGGWLARTTLPADRSRWGTFDVLAERAEATVREMLESFAQQPDSLGRDDQQTPEAKASAFYTAFMDTALIEAAGLAPAQRGLGAIADAKTHDDIARIIGQPDVAVRGPIDVTIGLDQKDPDRYIAVVSHAGLSLPDRDFYLRADEQFAGVRAKFVAHATRVFALLGDAASADSASALLRLETEIARRHWPIAKRRERELTYNLRSRAELDTVAPGFPWGPRLAAAGLAAQDRFVVRELDAMAPLAALFEATPVATWRTYLTYQYLRAHADQLPSAIDDTFFDFYGRTLNGQPEQRPRWKRAVAATNQAIGEAVGQAYVARFFPAAAKAQMLDLVDNVRRAYAQRIDALPWMTAETKAAAKEKLAAFRPKIGYPDQWRDYTALVIRRSDAFGNAERAAVFEWERQVARIDRKTDRAEWRMTPQTVNAYYNPVFNEIVFPAAILQPPFFDPAADPAVNYGAIGGIIGHEMGHGFDDQGAKSDARGVLRVWWNENDTVAFKKLGDRLAEQYAQYEPLPGLQINGRLTLGENIGDLGGLSVAYAAYRLSLGAKSAPVIDGLSGDQRFFLSWAQGWRNLMRDEALRNRVLSDPHSPPNFRVNGVVRNIDAWYAAFDVQPGDSLYLPPAQRVRIW